MQLNFLSCRTFPNRENLVPSQMARYELGARHEPTWNFFKDYDGCPDIIRKFLEG
jgi:hypothetical protein